MPAGQRAGPWAERRGEVHDYNRDVPPPPAPVQRLPFDAAAVPAIAAELGVLAREASYQVGGEAVYELDVPCAALPGARLLVVLWPSLRRVDVRLVLGRGETPMLAITRKDVTTVEIYSGIEVMFKRRPAGRLFVTRDGAAAVAD
ncbi:MAG: hypothetical protein ACRDI2_08610 [Chloroflexota bacterium]